MRAVEASGSNVEGAVRKRSTSLVSVETHAELPEEER